MHVQSNPDARPLPNGWHQEYDSWRGIWYYVDANVQPPEHSLLHPADIGIFPSEFSTGPGSLATSSGSDYASTQSSGPLESTILMPVPTLGGNPGSAVTPEPYGAPYPAMHTPTPSATTLPTNLQEPPCQPFETLTLLTNPYLQAQAQEPTFSMGPLPDVDTSSQPVPDARSYQVQAAPTEVYYTHVYQPQALDIAERHRYIGSKITF